MAGHSIHAEDANDRGEEDRKGETTPAVLLLGIHLVWGSINNSFVRSLHAERSCYRYSKS